MNKEFNSQEAIDYIFQNYSKLVKGFTNNKNSIEMVEEGLSNLVYWLHKKPRYIPNIIGWINISLKRTIINEHKYKSRFSYSTENEDQNSIEQYADNYNFFEELEKNDFSTKEFKKLKVLIDTVLTPGQKKSIEFYLQNDGTHICENMDNQKSLFAQASMRLKRVTGTYVDSPYRYVKTGSKRGRRFGYKPVVKGGRKFIFTDEQVLEIKKIAIIKNNRVINLSNIATMYNVSPITISKALKRNEQKV